MSEQRIVCSETVPQGDLLPSAVELATRDSEASIDTYGDQATTHHEMVFVHWNDKQAYIDRTIAPLIRELWKADIPTINSCEEVRPGWVWIQFPATTFAEAFLDSTARYDDGLDDLYYRIRREWTSNNRREIAGAWKYEVYPQDLTVDETELEAKGDEACLGPSHFVFVTSVFFPQSDLPIILAHMKDLNEANSETTDS